MPGRKNGSGIGRLGTMLSFDDRRRRVLMHVDEVGLVASGCRPASPRCRRRDRSASAPESWCGRGPVRRGETMVVEPGPGWASTTCLLRGSASAIDTAPTANAATTAIAIRRMFTLDSMPVTVISLQAAFALHHNKTPQRVIPFRQTSRDSFTILNARNGPPRLKPTAAIDGQRRRLGGHDANGQIERSIEELYAQDPERADATFSAARPASIAAAFSAARASPRWARRSAAPSRSPPTCRAG